MQVAYLTAVKNIEKKVVQLCMRMRCTYLFVLLDIRIGVIIVHEVWLNLY